MALTLTRLDKTAARVVGRLLGNSSKGFGKDLTFRIPDANSQYSVSGQRMYSIIASNVVAIGDSFTAPSVDFSSLVVNSYVHISANGTTNEGWMKVLARTEHTLTVDRTLSNVTEDVQYFLSSADVNCKGYIVDSSLYQSIGLIGIDYMKYSAIALVNLNQLPSAINPEKWLCFDNADVTAANVIEYKVDKIQPIYSGQVVSLGYVMLRA